MIAHNRGARHRVIADLLHRQAVRSQQELIDLLSAEGVSITQATLSRDLGELGATKVRDGRALVYRLPGPDGAPPTAGMAPDRETARLRRVCEELLVSAEVCGQFVVVRTPPGAANFLAATCDNSPSLGVVGTVAGDDTIFLATPSADAGAVLAARLLELADPGAAGEAPRLRG